MGGQDKIGGTVEPGLVLTNGYLSGQGRKQGTCPKEVSREMQRGMASEGTCMWWDGAKDKE